MQNAYPVVQWDWLREFKAIQPNNHFQVVRWYNKSLHMKRELDFYITMHFASYRLGLASRLKMRKCSEVIKRYARDKQRIDNRLVKVLNSYSDEKMTFFLHRQYGPKRKLKDL